MTVVFVSLQETPRSPPPGPRHFLQLYFKAEFILIMFRTVEVVFQVIADLFMRWKTMM